MKIDERTGGIASLFSRALNQELVDAKAATALNDYFYLPGSDLKGLQRNGPPRISVKETRPAGGVAAHRIRRPGLQAPRARSARRGRPRLRGDHQHRGQAPDPRQGRHPLRLRLQRARTARVRMDVGWAAVRPELDQIPASCKNWFSVQRWVDISNDRFGVTWSPVDAPLVRGRRHHGQPDRLADQPRCLDSAPRNPRRRSTRG